MRKQQIEWSEKRRQRRWLMAYRQPEETLRRWRRWTVRLSIAFAINAIVVIPFFKGNNGVDRERNRKDRKSTRLNSSHT